MTRRPVLTLLTACLLVLASVTDAGAVSAARRYPVKLPTGKGAVIFSIRTTMNCLSIPQSALIVRKGGKMTRDNPGVDISNPFVKSDFKDHIGHLVLMMLPPGDYLIYPRRSEAIGYQMPFFSFTVVEGGYRYLGEYSVSDPCTASPRVRINDEQDRDLGLIIAQVPTFEGVQVEKTILTFDHKGEVGAY